ncbi:unnamed protein product [Moneuplotes crassus]|uniref:Uncharacterized protein n=2 Tax=Euplotes crassus TaxID=5936 RepID=A0AAD1U5Q5_EUPCR|nr:unnamed protein product [Moneuplotes crassus]
MELRKDLGSISVQQYEIPGYAPLSGKNHNSNINEKSHQKLVKRYRSRLTLNKSQEPCDKISATLSKSPSALSRYNFVTTISNPAYVIAPVAKRKREFTNLETWKFVNDRHKNISLKNHHKIRIKNIDSHMEQYLEKQKKLMRKRESETLRLASTQDDEEKPDSSQLLEKLKKEVILDRQIRRYSKADSFNLPTLKLSSVRKFNIESKMSVSPKLRNVKNVSPKLKVKMKRDLNEKGRLVNSKIDQSFKFQDKIRERVRKNLSEIKIKDQNKRTSSIVAPTRKYDQFGSISSELSDTNISLPDEMHQPIIKPLKMDAALEISIPSKANTKSNFQLLKTNPERSRSFIGVRKDGSSNRFSENGEMYQVSPNIHILQSPLMTKSKRKENVEDISEEYSDSFSSEDECKMAKIKAKERFDFGNRTAVKDASIDVNTLDQMERLIITPKELYRNSYKRTKEEKKEIQNLLDSLPSLRSKQDKNTIAVVENNEEFQKFLTKRKISIERMARRVEELSKVKGCKEQIIEYVESKHRMRRLINKMNT